MSVHGVSCSGIVHIPGGWFFVGPQPTVEPLYERSWQILERRVSRCVRIAQEPDVAIDGIPQNRSEVLTAIRTHRVVNRDITGDVYRGRAALQAVANSIREGTRSGAP